MKKVLAYLLAFLIAIGFLLGLYYYFFFYNNCHLPIKYSVGTVDSRFKISQGEVLKIAQDAAGRWNNDSGYDLLANDPTASLTINLVYDYRQENLNKTNGQIENLTKSHTDLENYQQQYDELLNDYQNDLENYNNEVAYWNSRGGAPADIYQNLEQEKRSLNQRREELINIAKNLNLEARNYNENLSDLKNEINSRKNLIVTQGIYDSAGETINIYTFGNTDELRLVLMHEFGHSIGLGHAKYPTSIMYELLDQQDINNPTLTDEDISMLEEQCHLNYKSIPILDNLFSHLNFNLISIPT